MSANLIYRSIYSNALFETDWGSLLQKSNTAHWIQIFANNFKNINPTIDLNPLPANIWLDGFFV